MINYARAHLQLKKIILELEEIKQLVDLYGNTRKTFWILLKNNLKR